MLPRKLLLPWEAAVGSCSGSLFKLFGELEPARLQVGQRGLQTGKRLHVRRDPQVVTLIVLGDAHVDVGNLQGELRKPSIDGGQFLGGGPLRRHVQLAGLSLAVARRGRRGPSGLRRWRRAVATEAQVL